MKTAIPYKPGGIGELWVRGQTCCRGYWNQPEKSLNTFVNGWMRTGDKYRETQEGNYVHCGRSDDMLKVGGLWVSPVEVESALNRHAAVLEAAVIGHEDEQGLVKPKAYVVPKYYDQYGGTHGVRDQGLLGSAVFHHRSDTTALLRRMPQL